METVKKPLAEENLGLVHLCANKFRGRGIDYEELYSAGCIGLLKAVKAFPVNLVTEGKSGSDCSDQLRHIVFYNLF